MLNKALCDALEAGTGLGFKASAAADNGFRTAFGELLARAQRAGAVRADIGASDVAALLAGYLAMESQSQPGSHLGRIVTDGLRAGD